MHATLKPKVFVAMSGGVDSSVAAALLKKRGYEVVGVHMKCYNVDGCAAEDAEDARRAAEHLGILFYVFDFEKEYKNKVVEYMIDGYRRGLTPNPDVECNREIKFGLFLEKALEMGADYVATGHYVRLVRNDRNDHRNKRSDRSIQSPIIELSLAIAKDLNKDQSYFLWTLKQDQLKHCLFPIGEYAKPQVRKLAAKFGLHNALKKDSQGICFLGRVGLADFLSKYIKPKTGEVRLIREDGRYDALGEHCGVHFYTIGQRQGLNIGGFSQPLYVVEKDVKKNILTVAEGENHPALYKKEVALININFLASITNYKLPITVYARVRYRQPLAKAKLIFLRKSASRSASVRAVFSRPMKFVAPGQSAVFYSKSGEMLGGGIIV